VLKPLSATTPYPKPGCYLCHVLEHLSPVRHFVCNNLHTARG